MPFIGKPPVVGAYSVLDALTASATANYSLQLNGAAFVPNSVKQLLVSLNGVIQKPGSSFVVSGSTLTFKNGGSDFALTSSDSIDFIISMGGDPLNVGIVSDGTISNSKITDMAASKLTGALPAISGASLSDIGMVKLASASSTTNVATVEVSLDYAGYNNFRLILNTIGTGTSSGNLAFRWKRDGQSTFDTSAIYGSQGALLDVDNNHLNINGTGTYAYIVFTQNPNRGFQSDLFLGGFGSSTIPLAYHGMTSMTGMDGAVSSFSMGGSYDNATNAREKVKEIQIFFNTGDIDEIHYTLYGMKA